VQIREESVMGALLARRRHSAFAAAPDSITP
jgi:hypothetical protein